MKSKRTEYVLPDNEFEIIEETEKAIKIKTIYGGCKIHGNKTQKSSLFTFWSPKSLLRKVDGQGHHCIPSFIIDDKLSTAKGYKWLALKLQLSKTGCFGYRKEAKTIKYV